MPGHEYIPSPLILVGPSTAGKSDVAKTIVDMTGGHYVNADRYYAFARPAFTLGLGLVPGELEDGRPRHLFGILDPFDAPLSPAEYLARAEREVDAIHAAGGLAVIEGCTRRYNTALIGRYGVDHAVGIRWGSEAELAAKLENRVQKAVDLGLYAETEAALDAGYAGTFPMTVIPYRHTAQALHGLKTRADAERDIADEITGVSIAHQAAYEAMDGLTWFVPDRDGATEVALSAMALMGERHARGGREAGGGSPLAVAGSVPIL